MKALIAALATVVFGIPLLANTQSDLSRVSPAESASLSADQLLTLVRFNFNSLRVTRLQGGPLTKWEFKSLFDQYSDKSTAASCEDDTITRAGSGVRAENCRLVFADALTGSNLVLHLKVVTPGRKSERPRLFTPDIIVESGF